MDPTNHPIDDQQADEETVAQPDGGEDDNGNKKAAPAWLISVGVHAIAVAIMASVVFATANQPPVDLPPMHVELIPPVKPPEKPRTNTVNPTEEVTINIEEKAEHSNPIAIVEPTEVTNREEEVESNVPKGREEAVADIEAGSTGAMMAIGPGGGAAGLFGSRKGGGKIRATGKHGDNGRIGSVNAALRWFKRHQSPNGMWDVDGYQANCTEPGMRCEPGKNQAGDADIACTGYALMCFLGAGYDHRTTSPFRVTIDKGLKFLLASQKDDGLFGERNYEHAVATTALAEAYGVTQDPALKVAAQKAVKLMLARQGKDPKAKDAAYAGLGWDYIDPNPARIDSSVTGWNLMALKSALGAGLDVGNGLAGGKVWLERAWKARNPEWQKFDPYTSESFFPYVYDATTGTVAGNGAGDGHLSCVGALCAVFLGHHTGDPMLETLSNYIMKHDFPTAYPTNTYFLYYNTLAIFQVGGERWDRWNKHVATMLADAQRKDNGCFDGSWDYEGTQFHGHDTGRLLSTAYACLSQEVIWRYLQVGDGKAKF